jgi:signal transduction histidine kinase/ActR/RegA family two-component response regulator
VKERSIPYLLSLLLVALAILVTLEISPLRIHTPLLAFLAAVVFSAWKGGWGPGLISLVASMAAGWHVISPPDDWFALAQLPLILRFGLIGGLLLIAICSSRRKAEEQKLTTRALEEEYLITERLYEVATALSTELDLQRVVQIITDAATKVTGAQFGAFFYNVVSSDGGSYALSTLSGVPKESFEKFPMPRATELFGPTFRGEGVIRLEDVRQDPRFGKNPPHGGLPQGHLPVVSYLAVPVISRSGTVLGGLFFGHREPGVFTARDEKVVVGMAAQAAAAMDTARLYQAEQKARAEAEQATKAKDHFLAALSHELRTPLAPVLAILSELRQQADLPRGVAQDLDTIRRNVELETRLIDDLLDLTRIVRGKLELHLEKTSIDRLLDDAIETCGFEIAAKELKFLKKLSLAEVRIDADSARLTQILWNLVKNAVKFTPQGGELTISSRLEKRGSSEFVLIEVSDTGIGIEAERLAVIFDAFEQGDRAITRQFGGLGLGLAISRALAEAHGGTLTGASAGKDRGAAFTLALPLAAAETPEETGASFPAGAGAGTSAGGAGRRKPPRALRILLVEDHVDTAHVMVRLLRRMGHAVTHASNVEVALTLAREQARGDGLDLVMSDLGLPDGSGLDLMKILSAEYGLRGIALSGYGMEDDLRQSLAAGFSQHLTKPVDPTDVRKAIEHTIAQDGEG